MVAAVNPVLLLDVLPADILELTMVVLVPADGAAPLLLPKEGVLGEVALNNTYPEAVAPLPGNPAAVQLKATAVFELVVAVKLLA